MVETTPSAALQSGASQPELRLDNSYAQLPDRFFARCRPAPASAPTLIRFNEPLADELGLDLRGYDETGLAALFSGQALPEGVEPVAMAYAGHQFGNFVPQLGDGRALLLGEVTDRQGVRRDIQLKGAGRTPFSRHGDGLAPLGPVLREHLVSEAMHALGVPTTRSLAVVLTGDDAFRERPVPAAVLTRVARSHVRVGTFEYFAVRGDHEGLRLLADYVIDRHYPHLRSASNPCLALLEQVCDRQAALVAQWLSLGFIHGVMNTDNLSIAGETLDYGPCAFMDAYNPRTVFSFVDQTGRYAYENQPAMAQWGLARFAESLLPLLADDEERAVSEAQAVLEGFMPAYRAYWLRAMRAKLGLCRECDGDDALVDDLLEIMSRGRADFTLFFRHLCDAAESTGADDGLRSLLQAPEALDDWLARWRRRLEAESGPGRAIAERMRVVNPAVIPRTHAIENAIRDAEDRGDFAAFHRLADALARPFDAPPEEADYARPPQPHERVPQTFCGT
ncbi:YdiU family protein [Aquisalimonas lutea]|uniref:protein adenylyltransferase SelO n=1 Tax=Aquisalimonas lutea TaxID=1327750 RepID=UPI0025B58840|nr:YdiU family protein [Aquisalimonas lutea]MDN3516411.1 YdiU family protein [Aquisalimonas lutea]